MKRLAIFAHFDKKNIIDDYVLFYVNELKKYCETVLFLTLSDLDENELKKLDNIIPVKHKEYDFGSYKRGFEYAKTHNMLENIDEILFVNDSVYCINSLDKVFEKNYNSDFWGIVENKYGFKKFGKFCFSKYKPHLQSWFLAFRKNVFTSKDFKQFLNTIKEEKTKNAVIQNYEINLTKALKNFSYSAFNSKYEKSFNPTVYYWRELVQDDVPFIKRSVLLGLNKDKTTIENFETVIENKIVLELIKKNRGDIQIQNFLPYEAKLKMYDFLRTSKDIERRIFTKLLKTFYPKAFD